MTEGENNQIAAEAAAKIHWARHGKPSAYTQEDIARTKAIILRVIDKVNPPLKPIRIL